MRWSVLPGLPEPGLGSDRAVPVHAPVLSRRASAVLIPWSDISISRQRGWFFDGILLRFTRTPGVSLLIPANLAEPVLANGPLCLGVEKPRTWGRRRPPPKSPLANRLRCRAKKCGVLRPLDVENGRSAPTLG